MPMNTDTIQVWLMEVNAPPPTLMDNWRRCLDADELARAARFHFEPDRIIYTAAHWLLRNALAEAGDLPAAAWRFATGPHGKPRSDPALVRDALSFNLSHTKGLVACAVGPVAEIGIDVELMDPRRSSPEIAERFFSAAEIKLLRAAPAERRMRTFFRLWTLKETLIKTTGEGLQRALDSFSFELDPVAVAFRPADVEEAARWTFWELAPTAHHAAALAIREDKPRPLRLVTKTLRIDGDGGITIEQQHEGEAAPGCRPK